MLVAQQKSKSLYRTADVSHDAMSVHPFEDLSNGYDSLADEFMARRTQSRIGVLTVRAWAKSLAERAEVLDLGCGHGVPISEVLIQEGCRLYGVDASPRLIAAFRSRFPDATAECADVGEFQLPSRSFDGAIAWGLLFLLSPKAQVDLIHKVAGILRPGGSFLFTAPTECCEWDDVLTGRRSVSLGSDVYVGEVTRAGLTFLGEANDEGANHYYFASKPHGRGAV